jgi:hypothetical protein
MFCTFICLFVFIYCFVYIYIYCIQMSDMEKNASENSPAESEHSVSG